MICHGTAHKCESLKRKPTLITGTGFDLFCEAAPKYRTQAVKTQVDRLDFPTEVMNRIDYQTWSTFQGLQVLTHKHIHKYPQRPSSDPGMKGAEVASNMERERPMRFAHRFICSTSWRRLGTQSSHVNLFLAVCLDVCFLRTGLLSYTITGNTFSNKVQQNLV